MLLSQTLASMRPAEKGWSAELGEDWSQGRATFGGLVTALGNEAMRRLVPAERALRGIDTVFVGPAFAGTVLIEAELLRVGKIVTMACARLRSAGQIAATVTGIYGAARAVEIAISPKATPGLPRAEDLPDPVFPADNPAPGFLQHFGMRFAQGSRPFSGVGSSTSKVYVRHKDPAPLTESHVVALIDCIPSPLMQMMTRRAPSSSVTWTMQFIRHDYSYAPDAWWRIDTEVNSAGEGYACESSVVLDPTGVPAAFSRQLVTVYG